MNRETGKEALAISDVAVVNRRYAPHLDAYFTLGRVKSHGRTLRQAVAGWQPRHSDNLVDCRFFKGLTAARNYYTHHFNDVAKDETPEHPSLQRDWQRRRVYDWENSALMPFSQAINEKTALSMIRRVSRDYGIKAPQLVWERPTFNSTYDEDEHTIYFGARDNISLLHELAHAVHSQQIDEHDMPHHSPGFVWCAADLYHRYAGISLNTLVLSAQKHRLLGDLDTKQISYGTLDLTQRRERHAGRKETGPKHA